jgi:hypothetical protein
MGGHRTDDMGIMDEACGARIAGPAGSREGSLRNPQTRPA